MKMSKNIDISSSDTDDSEQERLQESVVDFNSSQRNGQGSSVRRKNTPKKPSLRPSTAEENEFCELDTTPEFRKHVAKRLMKMLDRTVESEVPERSAETQLSPKKEVSEDADFRLFSSSTNKPTECQKPRKRKLVTQSDSDSDDESDLSSVAVSGDFILNQGKKLRQEDAARFKGSLNSSSEKGPV